MIRNVVTFVARGIILVGLLLLAGVLYHTIRGSLVEKFFDQSQPLLIASLSALMLALPVPLHVISVGLILQQRWLSPPWARVAWIAIAVSGCWLGASLAVRYLLS